MATFTKKTLSGSTDGRPILVAATASAGTVIHAGPTEATTIDEVWLYASNPTNAQRTLTIQWGGTTSPDDHFVLFLPAQSGLVVVAPGLILKGNSLPLAIRAFSDAASQVNITGFVHEIS